MKNRTIKTVARLLLFSLLITQAGFIGQANAVTAPRLSKKSVVFSTIDKTSTVKIIGVSKKLINKLSIVQGDRTIAIAKEKSVSSISVFSNGIGKTTIKVKVTLRKKIKNKKSYTLKLSVTVKDGSAVTTQLPDEDDDRPTTTPKTTPSSTSTAKPTAAPTLKPTTKPTATPTVTPEVSPYTAFMVEDIKTSSSGISYKYLKKKYMDHTSGYMVGNIGILSSVGLETVKEKAEVKVEDVTPVLLKTVLYPMGMSGNTLKVELLDENLISNRYTTIPANTSDSDKSTKNIKPATAVDYRITASMGIRMVKLSLLWDGELQDVMYVTLLPFDSWDNYPGVYKNKVDVELCENIRHKIESKLWTGDMSNLQKIMAMRNYLSAVTHYPGSTATNEASNPEFYETWDVDGIYELRDLIPIGDFTEGLMLQGLDTADCTVVNYLARIAMEDLGLPSVGYKDTSKEGVYIAKGSQSSFPSNPAHYTLLYTSPDGDINYIDCQGQYSTCAEHHCKDKVISLWD